MRLLLVKILGLCLKCKKEEILIKFQLILNQAPPCQISFFPDENCKTGNTEFEMFEMFDELNKDEEVAAARPCIHYFRGVYCSGGHPDWPLC